MFKGSVSPGLERPDSCRRERATGLQSTQSGGHGVHLDASPIHHVKTSQMPIEPRCESTSALPRFRMASSDLTIDEKFLVVGLLDPNRLHQRVGLRLPRVRPVRHHVDTRDDGHVP